jgi:hypothetical protein
MKILLMAISMTACLLSKAQSHQLEKLWETDSIVATPESVLADAGRGILYVSLINGSPWEKDGRGGIAKLKTDGTGYDSTWVTGLNAPKGMGLLKNKLYVADISEVVVIDADRARVEKRIAIDSASGLNDVTVSDKGVVYVSDSKTGKVWRLDNDVPALYLENMKGVNGLMAVKDELMVASGKSFVRAGADKKITGIAELAQAGDGVEPIGNGDYLVSSWGGYIYYVSADGQIQTLLETAPQKRNTADIGYDAKQRIVYVPTFFSKTVAAYKLK